jgi:phenylacetate-CoA ligase
MVVVRGLNMFPTMVAAVINSFATLSGEYLIRLDKAPPYDRLPVAVEMAKGVVAAPGLADMLAVEIKAWLWGPRWRLRWCSTAACRAPRARRNA